MAEEQVQSQSVSEGSSPKPVDLPVQPQKPIEQTGRAMHTYADDLANALDATDAVVVQQILTEGRTREADEVQEKKENHQRKWYKAGATILIICTLAAAGYSAYHYTHLTVPAQPSISVGVFPSTGAINTKTTTIEGALDALKADVTIEEGRPYLVPLVTDETTLTLLSNSELFSYFDATASEPFLTSFNLLRLGVMNTGSAYTPFVIGLTKDPEVSAKELLIAEPDLLQMLSKPLGIDMSAHVSEVGKTFEGEYLFNIPVRTLRYDSPDEKGKLLMFYARATDNIVVFTTDPAVLKAVYDTLIRQR